MNVAIATLADRPDLVPRFEDAALASAWPEFMLHDPLANLVYAPGRLERFLGFALVAIDAERPGVALGRAVSVPFCFGLDHGRPTLPPGGWDTVVRWADQDRFLGRTPNAVCALEVLVNPTYAGRGLSRRLLEAMRGNAAAKGFGSLFAPVRPSRKHLEPYAPMAEYARRVREDGLPSDPWLRVHARAGGRIVGVAPRSMTIAATLAEWRAWTGLPFTESGGVLVPGALVPVHVSVEQDHAVYVEPNVWVQHDL